MTAVDTQRQRIQLMWIALVAVVGFVLTWQMALSWPHNYDEAFNYLFFADRGPRFAVTDYSYPNNHIFFSLIQGLIPRSLADSVPLALRGPNFFISAALLVVLTAEIWRRWTTLPKAVALVFAGPWALMYFPVARGYQLGALLTAAALLLVARYADLRWTPSAAAVMIALAAWTVPTFAFGAPIVAALYALRRRWRDATVYSTVFVVLAFLLYVPVLDQLFGDSTNSVTPALPFTRFARALGGELFFLPDWASLIILAMGAAALVLAIRTLLQPAEADERTRWSFLLLGFALTFVISAELITLFTDVSSPFVRNAAFASLFVPVGIWASELWRYRVVQVVIVGLLAWNVLLGVDLYQGVTDGSEVLAFEGTYLGHTPRLDELVDDGEVVEIRCFWTDTPTCELYQAQFEDNGVTVSLMVDTIGATECVLGSHPPQLGTGIDVVYRTGERKLVCFD